MATRATPSDGDRRRVEPRRFLGIHQHRESVTKGSGDSCCERKARPSGRLQAPDRSIPSDEVSTEREKHEASRDQVATRAERDAMILLPRREREGADRRTPSRPRRRGSAEKAPPLPAHRARSALRGEARLAQDPASTPTRALTNGANKQPSRRLGSGPSSISYRDSFHSTHPSRRNRQEEP